jgi:sialic acid synthase SpsE
VTRLFEAKPFIVAEVGSNWQTLEHCLASIRVAKEVGADAAKFQAYDYEALYGLSSVGEFKPCREKQEDGSVLVGTADSVSVVGELPIEWLPALKAEADHHGIELMCTAFSPELVAAVDPYVTVHKVASSDAAYPQLLHAVAKTGKPVLISNGGKTHEDMVKAVELLLSYDVPVVEMYCIAQYPADYVDLRVLGCFEGLSDHTLGYTAAVYAADCGATVIEKHFTAFPELDTPDAPHSLNPKQFKRMVDLIRGRNVETEEGEMFARHNRRLIATRDVLASEKLVYGQNFGAYRSLEDDTRGASPFDWEKVEGKVAKGAITRGKAIALEDVE